MRSLALVLALFAFASTLHADDGLPAPRKSLCVGTPAPKDALAEAMSCADGKKLSVEQAKGEKGTLVLFTCNHCPFVKAWQSRIVSLAADAAKKGIGVIAVNANDPSIVPGDSLDAMGKHATEAGYAFPYACDASGSLARAFGATRTPEAFLLDAQGRLAYHGAIDDNAENAAAVKEHWLADAIDAVAAGKEPAVKETKALGCSIKLAAAKS